MANKNKYNVERMLWSGAAGAAASCVFFGQGDQPAMQLFKKAAVSSVVAAVVLPALLPMPGADGATSVSGFSGPVGAGRAFAAWARALYPGTKTTQGVVGDMPYMAVLLNKPAAIVAGKVMVKARALAAEGDTRFQLVPIRNQTIAVFAETPGKVVPELAKVV